MTESPPVNIPRVARPQKRASLLPMAIGLGLLGTGVFASLVQARNQREEQASELPPLRIATASAPSAQPAPVAQAPAAPPNIANTPVVLQATPAASPAPYTPTFSGTPVAPGNTNSAAERARARLRAPALIVDLAQNRAYGRTAGHVASDSGQPVTVPTAVVSGEDGTVVAATGSAAGTLAGAAGQPAPATSNLGANERFAERVGDKESATAHAVTLSNLDRLVTQGTIVGAVLETALNSDLPGFARAVTTRDVLSFDGSAVLIPAGSRVIGEYNSGVAQGASRIFIVWNRLIRPDGVSITLASPAVDDLGRGGLGGKVNRHFFQRYGTAILLSVLSGGITALAQSRNNGSTVVVSNSSEASSLGNQASRGSDIAPTIKTKQGALVRIFVARDLDFSEVGPVRR